MNPSVMGFFASQNFAAFWLPGITVAVIVLFKTVSRSDRFGVFCKEDLAVGVDLTVASIFALAIHLGILAQKSLTAGVVLSKAELDMLAASPWILVGMLVGLVIVTLVTRLMGWKSRTEMAWFGGIIFPFIYGVSSLSLVARLITP